MQTRPHLVAMVTILCTAFLISQFYRASVGVLGPTFMAEMGLSAGMLGLLGSTYFIRPGALWGPSRPLWPTPNQYHPIDDRRRRCSYICVSHRTDHARHRARSYRLRMRHLFHGNFSGVLALVSSTTLSIDGSNRKRCRGRWCISCHYAACDNC